MDSFLEALGDAVQKKARAKFMLKYIVACRHSGNHADKGDLIAEAGEIYDDVHKDCGISEEESKSDE